MVKRILLALGVLSLTACSLAPGVYMHEGQFEPSTEAVPETVPVTLIPITPELVRQQQLREQGTIGLSAAGAESADFQYLVGPQDVLSITVWEHPELTIPAGGQRPVEQEGNQVRADGTIFYPYVGILEVAGKNTEQIRAELTEKLSRFIKKPQLDVRVVGFNSQKVHVAGAVTKPGVVPLTDVPMTLSDVINLSGGANEKADIQEVILIRDGKNRTFNLQDLYHKGDLSQNVLLQNRDIVYVPVNTYRKVYVMGEVSSSAALAMPDGKLNLAEVMASAGINQQSADPERIFVLRQGEEKPLAYHLDASEPGALILATTFPLQPLDVVFISTSDLSRWNRVLTQLLPTVQTLWTIDRISEGVQ
jgi:polysaccharide export outer membrane protein